MIQIIPSSPVTSDVVTLRITGAGCVINTQLIDNNPIFTAEITKEPVCFNPPPSYDFSFALGQLSSGNYTGQHRVTINGSTSSIVESTSFAVSGEQARSIPTLGTTSLMLLAMIFALTVSKFRKNITT
jgi:hypothetical protein